MSNETDLDWLARNVPLEQLRGWVQKDGEGFNIIPSGMPPAIIGQPMWHSFREVLARRAGLQNKPSWEDSPDWAEWLAQDEDGEWKWLAGLPGKYVDGWTAVKIKVCCKGIALGDWSDTLEKRPTDLSEQAVTERLAEATQTVLAAAPALMDEKFRFDRDDWFERGELPPVGEVCEAYLDYPPQWIETEIVAHKDGFAIGWCKSVMKGCHGDKAHEFRLIPTEREVLIEIIKKTDDTDDRIADAILAAGFKRGAA